MTTGQPLAVLSRHRVFAAYLLSLGWLLAASLWFASATRQETGHGAFIAALMAGTLAAYVLFWRLLDSWGPAARRFRDEAGAAPAPITKAKHAALLAIAGAFAAVFVLHMAHLEKIPLLAALTLHDAYDISIVRQESYLGIPVWLRYMSDYSFKAIGPALLVIAYLYRLRIFWLILAVGSLYAAALYVRILPLVFLTPLLIYLLLHRKWLHFALTAGLLVALLSIATFVSAPEVRGTAIAPMAAPTPAAGYEHEQKPPSAIRGLLDRALFVPGQVIDQWFAFYDLPDAREAGCGYRPLASLLACTYVPIPTKLYEFYYHENVERGMAGSLNAAAFMTDYANFGPAGVAAGAVLMAILFCFITFVYRDHPLALPMNAPLIMSLMETSSLTAINSGSGWLIMTALFLYFFRTR